MHYLIIDTCIWLNLGKSKDVVVDNLLKLLNDGKIQIVLPIIILEEWNRHKQDKLILDKKRQVQSKINDAKELAKLMGEGAFSIVSKVFEELEGNSDMFTETAKVHLDKIDSILNHVTTITLPIEDSIKLQAVNWALEKKAPFKSKNSMADCLILLTSTNYLITNTKAPCFFISDNTTDFSSSENKGAVHKDLEDIFSKSKLKYFTNLGQAMNEIETNIVSPEIVEELSLMATQPTCPNCSNRMFGSGWFKSGNGMLTRQYVCYQCNFLLDTGETYSDKPS